MIRQAFPTPIRTSIRRCATVTRIIPICITATRIDDAKALNGATACPITGTIKFSGAPT